MTRISFALLFAVTATSQLAAQSIAPPQVVATGYGEVTLDPDEATVVLALETRAATAAAAASQNAARVAAVRAALVRAGVPADSITTSGYSVDRNVEYLPAGSRVSGSVAINSMRVKTHRLAAVGGIIDAALAAGVTRIDGVHFGSSAAGRARREALAAAVAEARLDAEAMAHAAGGSLGQVLEISSSVTPTPQPSNGIDGALIQIRGANANTALTPADIRVSAAAQARWAFVKE
jgi:uncharacterized protein YggE